MQSGRMRHRITIKSRTSAQDAYGETDTWVDVVALHASKEPLLGNEFYRAAETQSKVEIKFRTRYVPGVQNEMRVYHGTEAYDILSAVDVESRHVELLLYCRKVV